MATQVPAERFAQLDSIRGIAAMGVLAFHLYLFWEALPEAKPDWALALFDWGPGHLIATGKTTLMFFLLSGFVLSYPFFAGRPPAYASYAIKRVVRIYVPYMVALAVTLGLFVMLGHGPAPEPPRAFAPMWGVPLSWHLVANHMLLAGDFDVLAYNAVIWSLVHELRLSLAIPLLVWAASRLSWGWNVAAALGLACLGGALHLVFHSPSPAAFYKTLIYVPMFVTGALLARHLEAVIAWYRPLGAGRKAALALGALLTYTYAGAVFPDSLLWDRLPADWATTAACAALVVTALGSTRTAAWLAWAPFRALGQLPYGIYLYHLPILYVLHGHLQGSVPLAGIYGLTLALTLGVAWVTRQAVEQRAARWASALGRLARGGRGRAVPQAPKAFCAEPPSR